MVVVVVAICSDVRDSRSGCGDAKMTTSGDVDPPARSWRTDDGIGCISELTVCHGELIRRWVTVGGISSLCNV